ncbi:AAA family ATPase [Planctomycetes bacterium K23_9]|uniref:ATP-dependent zinc metalloprotease FtsH n=1 Tax=Stieleria marina TaxID=1930275 RepID=A0A517NT99_9BACT|nr:ATP-dependent zinc metalloprotease FtsH [Planctomycetes bacterium K23_9]
MSDIELTLQALREAVRLAPGNFALTEHYVRTLLDLTRHDEAESFLSEVIATERKSVDLQLLMAEVFYRNGKNSHALAIVETLASGSNASAKALILHAKLLYRAGEVQMAVQRYKDAIERDEDAEDRDFANLLGIQKPGEWQPPEDDDYDDASEDEVVDGRIRSPGAEDFGGPDDQTIERPSIDFESVGGMESVKEQIRVKIIYPITHADMFAAYGKKAGGGILMYGPPGCGKTHIARATAGEVKANFISIGINDVLDMWMGNSERNLHQLFEQARNNRPCVLFFDEVDALGASRSDMRQSAGRHLVNQFLSELDGVKSNNEGVLILGATNAPWHVDSAFRRPGRFDEVVFVPPPDQEARMEVLQIALEGKPAKDVDLKKIANKTADFSGADLGAVVESAVEAKLHEAIKTGKPSPITTSDLLTVLKKLRPTTTEWFATARNHALYSNQGGTYDEILKYLKIK